MSWDNRIKIVNNLSKIDVNILGQGSALYVRVTREESIKQGLSIPNQRNRGLEVAANRGWKWVKVYVEPKHVSAELWIDKRTALAELINDLKTGKIKRVFARHQDRFWRSSEVRDKLLQILRTHEIEFWDFDSLKDYRTASGKFALKVQADACEYEKDITSERIREMKRGKAMSGRPAGGPPPYGYTCQARVKREFMQKEGFNDEEAYRKACEVIPNKKEWFINLSEAEVLLLIISTYLSKHPSLVVSSQCLPKFRPEIQKRISHIFQNSKVPMGSHRIAEMLNIQDYRNINGHPWNGSKVLSIINNPTAFGYVTYDEVSYEKKQPANLPRRNSKFFRAIHEPIIHPELWQEVQAVKNRNTANLRTKSRTGRTYPLSKLIFCGKCHSSMRAMSQGLKRPFAYYVCKKRSYYGADIKNNPRACDFPRINARYAEESIWKNLLSLAQFPSDALASLEKIKAQRRKQRPLLKEAYEQIKKEQMVLRGLVQKYYSRFETSRDSAEEDLAWQKLIELKTWQNELNDKEQELKQELSKKWMRQPEKIINYQLEKFKALVGKIKNRRLLYQALNEKYRFRVVAHERYLIEPRIEIDLLQRKRALELPELTRKIADETHLIKLSKRIDIQPADRKPIKAWIQEEQGKHVCVCGCGHFIQIGPQHRTKGIPRYKFGHHTFPLMQKMRRYNEKGLYTISQISKMLGIGHSTIRRCLGRLFLEPTMTVFRNKIKLFTEEQIKIMKLAWLGGKLKKDKPEIFEN